MYIVIYMCSYLFFEKMKFSAFYLSKSKTLVFCFDIIQNLSPNQNLIPKFLRTQLLAIKKP